MDRETLIRAILECNFAGFKSDIIDVAVKRIMECTEAKPVRHGRWIGKEDQKWHCSECDGIAPKGYKYNYCPHCGADMKEAKDAKTS